jgi:protein-S-isoprenylcysteine O-methyltransferase Ste14
MRVEALALHHWTVVIVLGAASVCQTRAADTLAALRMGALLWLVFSLRFCVMTERELHHALTLGYFALGVLTFASLFVITAPYGRHQHAGWGPTIAPRVGWIVMELFAVVGWMAIYLRGTHRFEATPLALMALWQVHYVNRTFVFPFRIRPGTKRMPLAIALMAVAFQVLNSYTNARWVSELGSYPTSWLSSWQFVSGTLIFIAGFALNLHSDQILINLRAGGQTGYKIPFGGAYRWISCPNYFAEMLEWTGWAILTWSLPGAAFAFYTMANLLPRAVKHHRWYKSEFADYPRERRAVIPYIL